MSFPKSTIRFRAVSTAARCETIPENFSNLLVGAVMPKPESKTTPEQQYQAATGLAASDEVVIRFGENKITGLEASAIIVDEASDVGI